MNLNLAYILSQNEFGPKATGLVKLFLQGVYQQLRNPMLENQKCQLKKSDNRKQLVNQLQRTPTNL